MTDIHPVPDGTAVDGLLSETGLSDDAELSSFLFKLRSMSNVEPPPPSAAVSALMASVTAHSLKRSRRRRTGLIALAVVASLGTGASAAAANPHVREATQSAFAFLAHAVVPGVSSAPAHSAHISTPGHLQEPAPEHVQGPAAGDAHAPAAANVPVPTNPAHNIVPGQVPAQLPNNSAADSIGHGQTFAPADRLNPGKPFVTPPVENLSPYRVDPAHPRIPQPESVHSH